MKQLTRLLGLLMLLIGTPAHATDRAPDMEIAGQISDADNHSYVEAPFDVPVGVTGLTVQLSHDGAAQRTTIDMGVEDPVRFRGWSGGNKASFSIHETAATPSYISGPIPPGTWRLLLGVPNIRTGVVTQYRARIWFDRDGPAPTGSEIPEVILKTGPGWYRGDLHLHTGHSDGVCRSRSGAPVPCPVYRTVETAEARGLDFVVITDHNTVSQNHDLQTLQAYFDRTLLIPGQEITTFRGHANALGVAEAIDFRLDGRHVTSATALADAVHHRGGLFSINHPALPTGEACMGCGWTAADLDLTRLDAVEIVNGGELNRGMPYPGPLSGYAFWRALLDQGLSPTAVGGSDNHDPDRPLDQPATLGVPTTVVYAQDLSRSAILAAIKAGHVFIDLGGVPGRLVELNLAVGVRKAMTGDHIRIRKGETASLTLHVVGVKGGSVALVREHGHDPQHISITSADQLLTLTMTGDGAAHTIAAVVYDTSGRAALLSNPIYWSAIADAR